MEFTELAQAIGNGLDIFGVVIVVSGVLLSTVYALASVFSPKKLHDIYRTYRHNLARSILLGLELLVAGDIIRSVAGDLNFDTVLVLGLIVLIRSLLSIEFEMEIEGRWPWKRAKKDVL